MDVPAVFALGSGEQVKCANWTADGWATLKIAADFDAHAFAVLVDDAETACASMPFEGAVFNCMHCYAQPDSIADVDLDNLHLSGAPPEK
jgi:hypothetical protein